jgi:hypothetical protein
VRCLFALAGYRCSDEVTGIFTTALATLAHRQLKGTLGNRRYRPSDDNTASLLHGSKTAPGRAQALARPHPGACVKGGIRTRFFHWREVSDIFTTSVGSAASSGKPD